MPTLEWQFSNVLNGMLNFDHQLHPSAQNKSRSIISRNGEPNYNPRRRFSHRTQTLQTLGPRNTQTCLRDTFHHGENSSNTTPETTFNCHCNTQFRNQTHQMI